MSDCGACGRAVHDVGTLCTGCTGALQLDLQRIGGYRHPDGRWIVGVLSDLLVTACRRDVIPGRGSGDDEDARRTLDHRYPATASETASPANLAALGRYRALTDTLTSRARDLTGTTSLPAGADPCRWLERRTDTIRLRDWAPAMLADLDTHLAHAYRLVDLPPALTIPCPTCRRRVDIDPQALRTECRCGEWGTVEWWVEQVAPPLPVDPLTLAELPAWLATRGYEVTHAQLRTWTDRGQLPCVTGGRGTARLYAARTVLEVVEASDVRRIIPATVGR